MSLRELIVAVPVWAVGVAAALLTTKGQGQRRKLLKRLLVTVALWVVLTAACFTYSLLHPSNFAYVGLFLLVGWFFFIPFVLAVVSVSWFICAKVSNLRSA